MGEVAVSVVLPGHEGTDGQSLCRESILRQTLEDIEVIGTEQEASGKYVLFADEAAVYEPDMLRDAYIKAEEDKADMVVCCADIYTAETQKSRNYPDCMVEWALPPYEPFGYRQIAHNVFSEFDAWKANKLYLREFAQGNAISYEGKKDCRLVFIHALLAAKRISTVREIMVHRLETVSGGTNTSIGYIGDIEEEFHTLLDSMGLFRELKHDYNELLQHKRG